MENLVELDRYPWSGHAVLIGKDHLAGQNTMEVLGYFGKSEREGRRKYRILMAEGVNQGRRDELVEGGLRRSQKLTGEKGVQEFDDQVLFQTRRRGLISSAPYWDS